MSASLIPLGAISCSHSVPNSDNNGVDTSHTTLSDLTDCGTVGNAGTDEEDELRSNKREIARMLSEFTGLTVEQLAALKTEIEMPHQMQPRWSQGRMTFGADGRVWVVWTRQDLSKTWVLLKYCEDEETWKTEDSRVIHVTPNFLAE